MLLGDGECTFSCCCRIQFPARERVSNFARKTYNMFGGTREYVAKCPMSWCLVAWTRPCGSRRPRSRITQDKHIYPSMHTQVNVCCETFRISCKLLLNMLQNPPFTWTLPSPARGGGGASVTAHWASPHLHLSPFFLPPHSHSLSHSSVFPSDSGGVTFLFLP